MVDMVFEESGGLNEGLKAVGTEREAPTFDFQTFDFETVGDQPTGLM
jgi:hypothetical protein